MAISSTASNAKTVLAQYYQAKYGFNRVDFIQSPNSHSDLTIMAEKYGLRKMMLVADTSSFTGAPNPILDNACQQLSKELDSEIAQLPPQRQMYYANLPPAQQQLAAQLNGIQYAPGAVFQLSSNGGYQLPNELDLRDKAIESLDDFMTLLDREKSQHNNRPEKAIVTTAQRATLSAAANPGVKKQRAITSLYGVKLVVRR